MYYECLPPDGELWIGYVHQNWNYTHGEICQHAKYAGFVTVKEMFRTYRAPMPPNRLPVVGGSTYNARVWFQWCHTERRIYHWKGPAFNPPLPKRVTRTHCTPNTVCLIQGAVDTDGVCLVSSIWMAAGESNQRGRHPIGVLNESTK